MKPVDYIIIAIVAIIVFAATAYIIKAKRSGQKCIGCPDSKTCSGHCQGCNGSCQSK
nr:FeoB-associated Cys-rich membrane protein [Oscillospiraceae bacterium]